MCVGLLLSQYVLGCLRLHSQRLLRTTRERSLAAGAGAGAGAGAAAAAGM